MGCKAEGTRAVGILQPSAGAWKRGEREDPREWDFTHPCNRWMKCGPACGCQSSWDFTHPCNRWMKCGPACGCQSSKASGKSRPRARAVSRPGPREGPTRGGLGEEPTHLRWVFPPGFRHQKVRRVQRKRERARQSGKKREIY